MKANTIDYNRSKLPSIILFNGKEYNGNAAFIKGYNGYTSTEDDGYMCALINNSCWDNNGNAYLLTDANGNFIRVMRDHSSELKIVNGIVQKYNLN